MRKLVLVLVVLAGFAAGLVSLTPPATADGGSSGGCITYCNTDPCGYTCCYQTCCGNRCIDLDCAPPPSCGN